MVIGFDFDKVFINYPPLVPYRLIDFLYKGKAVFKRSSDAKTNLHYRIPGNFEKQLRILSHYPIFRPPISSNIRVLKSISGSKKYKTYLVSSRFSFLRKRTNVILEKYKLKKYFDEIYFNYKDEQPHLFKEKTIKKLGIDTYVDDDYHLSIYLANKLPNLTIYWITNKENVNAALPKNVTPIKNLLELNKILRKNE